MAGAARPARRDPAEQPERVGEPPLRRAALLAAAALLTPGCGAGRSPCSPAVAATVGRLAGLPARARLVERGVGMATCRYSAGAARVEVTVDTLPQAFRRWSDAETELTQNTVAWHSDPAAAPQPVDGVGLGAYWVSGARKLSAADAGRLVTVTVAGMRDARGAAATVARRVFGRVEQQ